MSLRVVKLWRWPNPVQDSGGQHDNILRLSFREKLRRFPFGQLASLDMGTLLFSGLFHPCP